MKVPQKIRTAIKKCADYNSKATKYERIIVKWLQNNNLTEETASNVMRNMEDSFIDCCQLAYNPEEFIKILEEIKEDKQ